jgi:serine/threonine protein kinase
VGEWSEGTLIRGKYQIVAKVGQGGMAAVYKALHVRFNEPRAIKVINQELANDATFVRRFEQEGIVTRRLQHPNAVRVEDIDEAEDGRPFIVMEYIEGENLKDLIVREAPMPLARVFAIAKQVAAALDAAHRFGLVHRDIKPANIALLASSDKTEPSGDRVKVLDFGIAKLKEARLEDSKVHPLAHMTMTGTGVVIGTPAYMSPEQAKGLKGDQLDGRSDLYSLGVVMYQMFTGDLPLKADSTLELLMAHISVRPRPLHEAYPGLSIPDPVAAVVMRCLEKNRELRPESGRQLIDEIELAAGREPKPPEKLPASPTMTRRHVVPPQMPEPPAARQNRALHSRARLWALTAILVVVALAGVRYLRGRKAPIKSTGTGPSGLASVSPQYAASDRGSIAVLKPPGLTSMAAGQTPHETASALTRATATAEDVPRESGLWGVEVRKLDASQMQKFHLMKEPAVLVTAVWDNNQASKAVQPGDIIQVVELAGGSGILRSASDFYRSASECVPDCLLELESSDGHSSLAGFRPAGMLGTNFVPEQDHSGKVYRNNQTGKKYRAEFRLRGPETGPEPPLGTSMAAGRSENGSAPMTDNLSLPTNAQKQSLPGPLTRDDVIRLLREAVSADIVEEQVRQRGIDFQISEEVESGMRQAGATDDLFDRLRKLIPHAFVPATLRIQSIPAGALVYIDEEQVGATPTVGSLNVSVAAKKVNHLRLSLSGYSDYQEDLKLLAGEVLNVGALLARPSARVRTKLGLIVHALSTPNADGVSVDGVVQGSFAYAVGVESHDVILRLNKQATNSVEAFAQIEAKLKSQRDVEFVVTRGVQNDKLSFGGTLYCYQKTNECWATSVHSHP